MLEQTIDLAGQTAPGGGRLIAVVGPSGAGKDSLISYARDRLAGEPSVLFVRRVVTRPADPNAEDHASVSLAAFQTSRAAGAFAVAWQAHGLHYAIPAAVHDHLAWGGVAVVNGSRAALPAIRSAFDQTMTVHITCRPEVLSARLATRGREDAAQQQQRLGRATIPSDLRNAVVIDNSGDLVVAGEALLATILEAKRG